MYISNETVLSKIAELKQANRVDNDDLVSIDALAKTLNISRCELYQLLAQLAIQDKVVINPLRHMGYVDIGRRSAMV